MAELKREDLALRAERAVLVQVASKHTKFEADETLEELRSLVRAAGAKIVGEMRQQRTSPHGKFYVGTGKLKDLAALCLHVEADVVVCDDELSPSQVQALEEKLDCKVVDRSEVILDIFAAHALTRQAKLQVELAQLEYDFPRLTRMWTHLDRTAGGTLGGAAGGGMGVRGPGERQLEMDRRLVQRRIYDLKKKLAEVQKRRHTTAAGRTSRYPSVALVGYTNAGKSSLMNALTGADVSVKDQLFVTLDTRTRTWELPGGLEVVLSDTVGFIRKFPHRLAASFYATLEEAHEADLLLHIVDASKHESDQETRAVNRVLKEIDCLDKPTIYVLNKIDMATDGSDEGLLRTLVGEVMTTSAVTGQGLDELARRVSELVGTRRQECTVRTGVGNGRLISFLHANGEVLDQRYEGEIVEMTVRLDAQHAGAVRGLGGEVLAAD